MQYDKIREIIFCINFRNKQLLESQPGFHINVATERESYIWYKGSCFIAFNQMFICYSFSHSKDVRLPVQLQRVMAAEAEAAREARAKVTLKKNKNNLLN